MTDFDDILLEFERETRPVRSDGVLLRQKQLDLERMTRIWIHERLAPDILPFEGELVERMLEGIKIQSELVEMNSLELSNEKDIKLKLLVVESELERVSFLVRSYLRTRLSKIDEFAVYIRSSDELLRRLSKSETIYMEQHLTSLAELYNNAFLVSLPSHLHALDDTGGGVSMVDGPELDKPVFVRVERTVPEPVIVGEEEVELVSGSVYLLRYSAVKDLIAIGDVVLI